MWEIVVTSFCRRLKLKILSLPLSWIDHMPIWIHVWDVYGIPLYSGKIRKSVICQSGLKPKRRLCILVVIKIGENMIVHTTKHQVGDVLMTLKNSGRLAVEKGKVVRVYRETIQETVAWNIFWCLIFRHRRQGAKSFEMSKWLVWIKNWKRRLAERLVNDVQSLWSEKLEMAAHPDSKFTWIFAK